MLGSGSTLTRLPTRPPQTWLRLFLPGSVACVTFSAFSDTSCALCPGSVELFPGDPPDTGQQTGPCLRGLVLRSPGLARSQLLTPEQVSQGAQEPCSTDQN